MTSRNRLGETRLILIGAAVLLSLGMGIRQSFGLFLTPVTRDLALTAADFTLAVAVQNIVWGLSQAPIGAIADRFGLHHDDGGRRDLRRRATRDGRGPRCHRADRLRRID
jgi:MFS family permease